MRRFFLLLGTLLVLAAPIVGAMPTYLGAPQEGAFPDDVFLDSESPAAAGPDSLQQAAFRPVLRRYYDSYWSCDLNGDAHIDLVVQNFDTDTRYSYLYAYSGSDGKILWSRYNWDAGVGIADLYAREGEPQPRQPIKPINLRPANADLDGDGVCDFVQFVIVDVAGLFGTPPLRASAATFRLEAVSGLSGRTIWMKEYEMAYVISDWMRNSLYWIIEAQNVPTDLEVFVNDQGAHIVLKTSDIFWHRVRRPIPDAEPPPPPWNWNYHIWNNEHVRLIDAKTGAEKWTRDILFSEDPERTRFTWVTGLSDITGDGLPEVVLDQYYRSTPTYEELKIPPQSEENFAEVGKGMNVLVLDGRDGKDLWNVNLRDEEFYRKNPRVEETFEALKWTYAQVVPDITGDGKDEVVALFLTQKMNAGNTVNGAYTTHVIPLHGKTGDQLWKNDVRIQGWGFVTTLHTPGRFVPAIAAGTVDIATAPIDGGVFPPKDVRISLLNATDGTPFWTYEERFAQANYLSSELALQQYLLNFAPHDWTGDGVLDILTPSAYVSPGDGQVLLATAKSRFRMLDGGSGRVINEIEVGGSNAAAAPCVGPDGAITTVGGHSQALEMTRVSGVDGTIEWKQPIWYEATTPASSAGYDIVFLDVTCADHGGNATYYTSNLGLQSEARGMEIVPLYGGLRSHAEPLWQIPHVEAAPPEPSLSPLDVKEGWTGVDGVLVVAAPLVVGTGIGVLGAFGLSRRLASTRWLKGLPELMIVFVLLALILGPAVTSAPLLHEGDAATNDEGIPFSSLAAQSPFAGAPEASKALPPPAMPVGPSTSGQAPAPSTTGAPDRDVKIGGPYGELLQTMAHDAATGRLAPATHMAAVRDYFATLGYGIPKDPVAPFNDNFTVSYTRPVGDVDGDGTDDLLVEDWCLAWDKCPMRPAYIGYPDPAGYVTSLPNGGDCGLPHRLAVRSGTAGTEVWNLTLNSRHPVRHLGCQETFIMGRLPTPDGHVGILAYTLNVFRPALVEWYEVIEHTYELIDVTTGQPVWTYSADGYYTWNYALKEGITHADTFLLTPIIQAPVARQGLNPFGEVQPSLMLQSVGFEFAYLDTLMGVPPQVGHFSPFVTIIHTYQPNEWVARINLNATGANQEIWRVKTFEPELDLSVLPYIVPNGRPAWFERPYPNQRVPNDALWYSEEPGVVQDQYWNAEECCFDVTGDGVNDLVYKTIEWNGVPTANARGPYFYDATIVAFDGATGRRLYDVTHIKDLKLETNQGYLIPDLFRFEITTQAAGDLDGDDLADYLVHIAIYDYDYERRLLAVRGVDGKVLWQLETARDLDALIAGDADQDGGNDVLVIEFIDWEQYWSANQQPPQFNYWWVYNVTRNPLALYSGDDGEALWKTYTWQAPADLLAGWKNHHRNGLPDIDGDGVADIVVDDPILLKDLTIVHRPQFRSGRDLSLLWEFRSVGGFLIPIPAGDADGDGDPDIMVVSGDRTDLWITLFEGQSGEPIWSRRLLETRLSNAGQTKPQIDLLRLSVAGEPVPQYVVNLHLITTTYRNIFFSVRATTAQLLALDAASGNRTWSAPGHEGPVNETVQSGLLTPASELYLKQYEGRPLTIAGTYPNDGLRIQIAAATFGASSILSFVIAFRRWKP